jgi:hypothetical protein
MYIHKFYGKGVCIIFTYYAHIIVLFLHLLFVIGCDLVLQHVSPLLLEWVIMTDDRS